MSIRSDPAPSAVAQQVKMSKHAAIEASLAWVRIFELGQQQRRVEWRHPTQGTWHSRDFQGERNSAVNEFTFRRALATLHLMGVLTPAMEQAVHRTVVDGPSRALLDLLRVALADLSLPPSPRQRMSRAVRVERALQRMT